jgi:hypothetical protein
VTDELGQWAARLAPELRARAESEAVATLRDALVAAALGESRRRHPAAAPKSPGEFRKDPGGVLLWTYCVARAGDPIPADADGVGERTPVRPVEAAGLVALVSEVPRADFAEEPLRRNLNDLPWLERSARAHEAVLERALALATIVPLRLCTIYESEERVREMLARERRAFSEALDHLDGRQEWGVKLLVDPELLAADARARSDEADVLEQQMAAAGEGAGGAYMLRRRLERHVREVADSLAARLAEDVYAALAHCALDAVTRSPQSRELSGHEGEMLLNAAYLVAEERVEELRDTAATLELEQRALGARIEVSGPWPPYNFVPGDGTAAIA